MIKTSFSIYIIAICGTLILGACNPTNVGSGDAGITASSSTSGSTTTSTAISSSISAIQIIPKTGSTGSFDNTSVPTSGGVAVKSQRIFALDGSQIATGNVPAWFSEASVFLTSTRTQAGTPGNTGSDTACAYFDTYSDNNPDSDGFYTIDGYNGTNANPDIDQCAGTAASELNKLSFYIKVDRRFMSSTEKLQVIVKAKPIDAPNLTPTTSTCVTGGYFDAANCSNQYFAITMRTAPYAASQPFYVLFPSAKNTDLLSESILLPIHVDSGITTISIDRYKGGAVFYGFTILRL